MKYRLTKLSDDKFNGKHPNFINEGYIEEGNDISELEIGKRFRISNYTGRRYLETSKVIEIVTKSEKEIIFKTENSTYKLKINHEKRRQTN